MNRTTSSRISVTWFSNQHEHSVQWCKLGFMRLADAGEISLAQIPNELAGNLLPRPLVSPIHRRKAIIAIEAGGIRRTVVLDGEDSVFQTSDLIRDCDFYFVCAYRGSFYRGEPFDLGYVWQTGAELAHYRKLWSEKQEKLRGHLHKARPFMPIGPDLTKPSHPVSWVRRKLRNGFHRCRCAITRRRDWRLEWKLFEDRYSSLVALRNKKPKYDVVLKDSLWGWPRHRVNLHNKLCSLSKTWKINSQLNYRDCFDYEFAGFDRPKLEDFPVISGDPQGDYEEMLAASRLGIFATGFHWGCRNIQTLAWFLGLHVYSDTLSFEVPVDLKGIQSSWHTDGTWSEIEPLLRHVNTNREAERKIGRASAFDRELAPEVVARRVLTDVLG